LGIPPVEPRALAAAGQVLDWLCGDGHRKAIRKISGLTRRCASQEGNALAVSSRLGLAGDARVKRLAESLIEWQWPDGGWNCDKNANAHHSSFHESLPPLWGLLEYRHSEGERSLAGLGQAIERAAEFFLCHRLFRSDRNGEVIHPEWLKLHYPPYWHYDILQALLVFSRRGPLDDPRMCEALDILEEKRLPDGRWSAQARYWKLPGRSGSNVEVVNWGHGPHPMITLNALRVLKAAGRV
jgi:hypothetical protein